MNIHEQLAALQDAIALGAEEAPQLAAMVVANIQTDAAQWTPQTRETVYRCLQNLIGSAHDQREQAREQMRSTGASKRAIAGYGQLRPSRVSQRTNKQA